MTWLRFLFGVILLGCIAPLMAKSPPPGTGSANVPANILIMLDTSGSMGITDATTNSLSQPNAVAVDASGNVFVAEIYYHRIKKFNSSGTLLSQWGSWGTGNGRFRYPYGISVDTSGNVYVADHQNHRIQKFNNSGTYLSQWGSRGAGNGQFYYPFSVAVDASGNVYVSDNTNRIQKFNSSGAYITQWGSRGTGNGQFNFPIATAVDASGNVYVSEHNNHRIQKFNSSGTYLSQWGSWGTGNGRFRYPYGISVDTSGNLYVADQANHRIQKFNSSGTYITQWGSYGSGNSQFVNPVATAVDASGNVYVADFSNNRIQKFSSTGTYLATIGGSPKTRLDWAKQVIKKIVTDPDLTQGAYFGLMNWHSRASMRVNVAPGGAAAIYTDVDRLIASGATNLDSAMSLAQSYLSGPSSPINASLGCQKTILIVISDGEWYDSQASRIAENLYKTRGIQTYAVGFGPGVGNTSNYVRLSQAGGTYPASPMYASNYQDLYERLAAAIRAAVDARLTFTSPTIMPGVGGTDALFQSVFDYKKDHQWQGRFIKYALNADGSIGPQQWDAGALLNTMSEGSRKIWTVGSGLTAGLNNFTDANRAQLQAALYEGAGIAPTDAQLSRLVRFVRGVDAYDENSNGNSTEERWKLGDIYHSEAAIVSPPAARTSTRKEDINTEAYYRSQTGYEAFKSARATRPSVVYVGANDGMLHAFNADTGIERWAFIPPPLLPKLRAMESASANKSNSIYGVDGSPAVNDVFYAGRWRTVLVSGLGSGGKGYFALDVTDPDNPAHLFSFAHDASEKFVYTWAADGRRTTYSYLVAGAVPAAADFSALGDAWSKPVILPIPYLGGTRWVAVIGGGYSGGAKTGYGSAVYVLDLENSGQVLAKIALADNPASDIGNGVAPTLAAITADGTTLAAYRGAIAYFTDLQGKLWKINLTGSGTLFNAEPVFNAEATRANDRWAYHGLGSSIVADSDGANRLYHFFGTGNQLDLHRMDNAIQNRVFGVKDKDFPATRNSDGAHPFTAGSALQDIAPGSGVAQCPLPTQRGWYANLATVRVPPGSGPYLGPHQRVTGKAAIYNKSALFSLYQPQIANACDLGTGRLLELEYRCGSALQATTLGSGIPTGAVVHKGKVYLGISGSGGTPPTGWTRKDSVLVGTPAAGAVKGGAVKIESWREVR
jgi:sugar lactone lactonase YvrE